MNKYANIPLNWYDIQNFYKRYYDVPSNLIYESENIIESEFAVTIAIPTFHRHELLTRTLDSALNQVDAGKYEVIVVDNDGEGDSSADKIMQSYCRKYDNVRYYRNEQNIGMTGNWNRCIELAAGKWVVLLHDDDVILENYLKSVLPWAEKSDCAMIGVFHTDLYDDEFNVGINETYGKNLKFRQNVLGYLRRERPFVVKKTDIFANVYPSPVCAMLNKEKAIAFGGFDGKEGGAYDEKFFATEIFNGKVLILPLILARRGVGINESLKADIQKAGIAGKYNFAMHVLNKERFCFKRYKKLCADVSARYMVESVRGHFNADVDFNDFLEEIGVSKMLIGTPRKVVTVLKYFPLLALIFRRTY